MELDDFKAHWNIIQDKEFQQQKLSTDKLEQIVMNTTDTLNLLQSRTDYWKHINKTTTAILSALLPVLLVLRFIDDLINHNLADMPMAVVYALVIFAYSRYSVWFFKRQEQIFSLYNNVNVKESLSQTIKTFKAFYLNFNLLFVLIGPIYFYAIIKLCMPYWHASQQAICIASIIATIVSLIASHWHYSVKFLKKIKSLEENLEYLNNQQE